jgi:hypothetical protein
MEAGRGKEAGRGEKAGRAPCLGHRLRLHSRGRLFREHGASEPAGERRSAGQRGAGRWQRGAGAGGGRLRDAAAARWAARGDGARRGAVRYPARDDQGLDHALRQPAAFLRRATGALQPDDRHPQRGQSARPSWQRLSSVPAPPQGAPGGSGQLGTPKKRPAHWAPSRRLGCSS